MLQNARTASPCSADWKKMAGDERVRFCSDCNRNVYNFSAMTGREIESLLASREGRVCARLFRRSDGTILTADCPVGVRAVVRRVSRIAGAALTAALSVSFASAQQAPKAAGSSLVQIETQKTASLAIRIKDQTDALVPEARVLLTDEATLLRVAEGQTDKAGELSLTKLAPGSYSIQVEFPGFSMDRQTVILSAGVLSKVDLYGTLHDGAVVGEVVVPPKHPVLSRLKGLAHKVHF